MTADKVNTMLRDYRDNLSRAKLLEQSVAELRAKLDAILKDVAADVSSLAPPKLDGMPHGNAFNGSPTERLGIMLASGYEPEDVKDLRGELMRLQAEYRRVRSQVSTVDAWLLSLNPKQNYIVRSKAIDNLTWVEIIYTCKQRYGIEYSRNGIRKIYKLSMERVYRAAGAS